MTKVFIVTAAVTVAVAVAVARQAPLWRDSIGSKSFESEAITGADLQRSTNALMDGWIDGWMDVDVVYLCGVVFYYYKSGITTRAHCGVTCILLRRASDRSQIRSDQIKLNQKKNQLKQTTPGKRL